MKEERIAKGLKPSAITTPQQPGRVTTSASGSALRYCQTSCYWLTEHNRLEPNPKTPRGLNNDTPEPGKSLTSDVSSWPFPRRRRYP